MGEKRGERERERGGGELKNDKLHYITIIVIRTVKI